MVRQDVWRLAKYCVWLGCRLWRLASAIVPFLAAPIPGKPQAEPEGHSHARLSKSRWDPALPSAMSFKGYFL